jgi:predicted AlkP superfamily phosphohydrolase/phosphomutase
MVFRFWKGRPKLRTLVIGLDGVPHSLLQRLARDGVMPEVASILGQGRFADMTVTLPEISSVSWSTFMTGTNPGEHGIFGFTDLEPTSYEIRFPNFADLKVPTLWDRLGERGMKSVVINQPATYPARPIPGVLVSGFVAIDLERAVSPPKWLELLRQENYEIDLDTGEVAKDPERLFRDLHRTLETRERVVDRLWREVPWNLFEVVVTGTDRLHHFQWDAGEDADHPHHRDFLDYYRAVDRFVGRLVERFRQENPEGEFFLLSDHGFCRTRWEVYVNAALREAGYLHIAEGAKSLATIQERSVAFALDPARIYVNRTDRFPKGSVRPADVPRVRDELADFFASLEVNGEKVVRRVFTREEAYQGPWAEQGPDLLLVPNPGFDLKGRPGATELVTERRLQGMHTWDDAFVFASRADRLPEGPLTLTDVPPAILGSLGFETS